MGINVIAAYRHFGGTSSPAEAAWSRSESVPRRPGSSAIARQNVPDGDLPRFAAMLAAGRVTGVVACNRDARPGVLRSSRYSRTATVRRQAIGGPHMDAAWVRDPMMKFDHRWFDGSAWTSQISRAGTVLNDRFDLET